MADQMLNVSLSESASVASTARSSSTLRSDTSPRMGPEDCKTPSASVSSGSTPSTSSRTRERLRQAELERDELRRVMLRERANASEMRRLAERQQAVAERLKREGNTATSGLSAMDAKFRMLELERDARAARAERRAPTKGLFKAACSTDLLFLIDTTGSMYSYIDAAKKQVLDIVKDIKNTFLNDVDVRIAVVSYKDHYDQTNIESIDFTTSADEVRSFIETLDATGGSDTPEDVLGGIQTALDLSWQQQTRCIIHIADAPAHGNTLNVGCDDNFPEPGSEPHALTYEPLLQKMISLNINYAFLRITSLTDLMTFMFLKQYAAAAADASLHASNSYWTAAQESVGPESRASSLTAKASLLFAELELGTTYHALRRLVISTVTSSASRTAVRVSSLRSSAWGTKTPKTKLSMLSEEEVAEEITLDTSPPQWDVPGWLDEKLTVEGFSPNVVVHGAGTLDDKMASDDNITMSVSELTISKRSQPFAQGAMRVASYAGTAASDNRYVVKSFKRSGKRLAHLVEDMRCQALCKAFALEFNALSDEEQSIDFIATTCFKGKSAEEVDSADNCLSLEPYIQGTYLKYNNNCGWVNETDAVSSDRFNQAAQAFSHFTFERSQGRFLVCDLQGVGCVLTDPAIHTLDPERFKLTDSNLGEDGFRFFFSTHTCNAICAKLGLVSHASMFRPGGVLTFRTTWPRMDRTTCCSNKLCGKIIHVWMAKRLDEYPGYSWCTPCWLQLKSSKKQWLCVAGEPDHEFDVSPFFYESQGRKAPRKCVKHRGDEEGLLERGHEDMSITVGWYPPSSTLVPIVGGSGMPTPPPYVPPGTYASSPTLPSPGAIGAVATVRNSNSIWAKLKSATKIKKSSSRNLLSS